MQSYHSISPEHLSIERVTEVITSGLSLDFSKESEYLIEANRRFLENKLKNSNQNFYGINTGFGSLCDIRISNDELEQLQENLVKSHAAGVGEEVPQEIIKIMLLLKIQSLALGHSGIRMVTIKMLADFFNLDIIPVVYQLGSLGASGDLAPLAHLSLPLIGLGEVYFKGERMAAPNALKAASLQPIKLQAKEGLALLNGTQFSAAYGVWCLSEMKRWFEIANLCAALSMEAFNCHTSPFDERLQKIRPHEGQLKVAERIRDLRANSPIAEKEKIHVQDPYAFRCVLQVHGATWG
ncbi:MAG TPA: aromatic amino acid ammonia-lyase, partial [Saprospiraceae bacterium]|nr:aromatic amino acid ammonia-lyase [Saprospiraceae bacterium]